MGRSWLSPYPSCFLSHLIAINLLSRSNALLTWDNTYFKHCLYDPLSSPYCPVFRIGDLVAMAGGDFEDLALLVSYLGQCPVQLRGRFSGPYTSGTGCVVCRVVLWASAFTGIATWTRKALTAVPSTPSSCSRKGTTSGMALTARMLAAVPGSGPPPPSSVGAHPAWTQGLCCVYKDSGCSRSPGSTLLPSLACPPPADLLMASPR